MTGLAGPDITPSSRLACPLSLKTPNMGNPGLQRRIRWWWSTWNRWRDGPVTDGSAIMTSDNSDKFRLLVSCRELGPRSACGGQGGCSLGWASSSRMTAGPEVRLHRDPTRNSAVSVGSWPTGCVCLCWRTTLGTSFVGCVCPRRSSTGRCGACRSWIKMGGRVRHSRRLIFQLSEVSVPRRLFEGVSHGRLSRRQLRDTPRSCQEGESAPGSRLVFNALSPHWRGPEDDEDGQVDGSRQESHPLSDTPEIDWPCRTRYHAIISFGLPIEPEDSQYGKSRSTNVGFHGNGLLFRHSDKVGTQFAYPILHQQGVTQKP